MCGTISYGALHVAVVHEQVCFSIRPCQISPLVRCRTPEDVRRSTVPRAKQ